MSVVDADLGGNLDNGHSQTSYIGYLGKSVVCWCSTDQESVSTSTAESEIKAVNHTLKGAVISNRGILNAIGWTQEPTKIEEDNQACVYASESKHMTRNLRQKCFDFELFSCDKKELINLTMISLFS